VHQFLGDSRTFLADLAKREDVPLQNVFFYLDAHWEKDLPLYDEVRLILENWRNSVVMIDDFQVPDDSGYAYDDYGNGNCLTLDYLKELIEKHQLAVFFPSAASGDETGHKRGCVILADKGPAADRLTAVESLRQYTVPAKESASQ
jgi:hypothetical protein